MRINTQPRPAASQPLGLRRCRGLGLVEMMVALLLGLFLVGVTASMLLGQLGEHRRRLLDVRVSQELRSAAALMARDLRRAGYWGDAGLRPWLAGDASSAAPVNPYIDLYPATGSANALGYSYSRDATENQVVDANERLGFRLNASSRALDMRLGGAALAPADGDGWQALTDPNTARVTRLATETQLTTLDLGERCSLPCPAGATDCPPRLVMRVVRVDLEGTATIDAGMQRRLRSSVRLRADALSGQCPGA